MNFSDYEHLGNDWHPINNTLSEAIYKTPFLGSEFRLIGCLMRKTYGYRREDGKRQDRVWISLKDLAEQIGVSKRTIQNTLRGLVQKKVVKVFSKPDKEKHVPGCYGINSKVSQWKIEQDGGDETYPRHKKYSAKPGRPIVHKNKVKKGQEISGKPDHLISETISGKPDHLISHNQWKAGSPGSGKLDHLIMGHAACNHAPGSPPTKTLSKILNPLTPLEGKKKSEEDDFFEFSSDEMKQVVHDPKLVVKFKSKISEREAIRVAAFGFTTVFSQTLGRNSKDAIEELCQASKTPAGFLIAFLLAVSSTWEKRKAEEENGLRHKFKFGFAQIVHDEYPAQVKRLRGGRESGAGPPKPKNWTFDSNDDDKEQVA